MRLPSLHDRPVRTALLSLVCLASGLAAAFPGVGIVAAAMPWLGELLGIGLFYTVMLATCAAAGALWGSLVAGRQATHPARAALAGALGFGLSAPAAVYGLTMSETKLLVLAQGGLDVPMHVAFAAVFPAAAFFVVFGSVGALLTATGARARAWRIALRCAAIGAGLFLAVAVTMDLAGWRIGAPDAEARFTMVVVMLVGLVATALGAGIALGRALDALGPARAAHPSVPAEDRAAVA